MGVREDQEGTDGERGVESSTWGQEGLGRLLGIKFMEEEKAGSGAGYVADPAHVI